MIITQSHHENNLDTEEFTRSFEGNTSKMIFLHTMRCVQVLQLQNFTKKFYKTLAEACGSSEIFLSKEPWKNSFTTRLYCLIINCNGHVHVDCISGRGRKHNFFESSGKR